MCIRDRHKVDYMTAGENIAKGQNTPEYVMKAWMNSPGHRKNILNPRFEEMGVSRDEYGNNIWTQMFIAVSYTHLVIYGTV